MLDGLGDEFDLLAEGLILLAVHLLLEDEVDHHNLACFHGCSDLLAFLLPDDMTCVLDAFDFLGGLGAERQFDSLLLRISAYLIPLFLKFSVISIPLIPLYFFPMALGLAFRFGALVSCKLVHALSKHAEEGVLLHTLSLVLLHQLYKF